MDVYKQLREDFDFVTEYGFKYDCDIKHNVNPYIVYLKGKSGLHIGVNYSDHCLFAYYIKDETYPFGVDILENVERIHCDYWNQYDLAKKRFENF